MYFCMSYQYPKRISDILTEKWNFLFSQKRFLWIKPEPLVKNGQLMNFSFFVALTRCVQRVLDSVQQWLYPEPQPIKFMQKFKNGGICGNGYLILQ